MIAVSFYVVSYLLNYIHYFPYIISFYSLFLIFTCPRCSSRQRYSLYRTYLLLYLLFLLPVSVIVPFPYLRILFTSYMIVILFLFLYLRFNSLGSLTLPTFSCILFIIIYLKHLSSLQLQTVLHSFLPYISWDSFFTYYASSTLVMPIFPVNNFFGGF